MQTTYKPIAEMTDHEIVVAFLHHNGHLNAVLSAQQQQDIRLLADGFGQTSNLDLVWDWSHVRDSSDEGFARMATAIRGLFS